MTKTHQGSCHCGAIRFRVEADLPFATRCNCTNCTKSAWLGTIVKPDAFELLAGEDALAIYEWGGRTAKFHHCRHCGVKVFGLGSLEVLGGAYVSISVNALDDVEISSIPIKYFDGRHDNWMAGMRDTPWPILADVERVTAGQ